MTDNYEAKEKALKKEIGDSFKGTVKGTAQFLYGVANTIDAFGTAYEQLETLFDKIDELEDLHDKQQWGNKEEPKLIVDKTKKEGKK